MNDKLKKVLLLIFSWVVALMVLSAYTLAISPLYKILTK